MGLQRIIWCADVISSRFSSHPNKTRGSFMYRLGLFHPLHSLFFIPAVSYIPREMQAWHLSHYITLTSSLSAVPSRHISLPGRSDRYKLLSLSLSPSFYLQCGTKARNEGWMDKWMEGWMDDIHFCILVTVWWSPAVLEDWETTSNNLFFHFFSSHLVLTCVLL